MALPKIPFLLHDDSLNVLQNMPSNLVDLIYIDPPFFTGKTQIQFDRTLNDSAGAILSFNDVWASHDEYLTWMTLRLKEAKRVLKPTGSLFLHCDWHASHLLRVTLDEIFFPDQFRGEIIWFYKRWTNGAKLFQRSHQTIYFYSKTDSYKFNKLFEEYSFTTNIDQIWQKRGRDKNGKCITVTQKNGEYVTLGKEKPGVPMRDVWEIPYLNPRAKERTGWPTQKPIALMRRIILATTDEGDIVLDPMCGSGTTLVAAKALRRQWIGIDSSKEAIKIAKKRLSFKVNPFDKIKHDQPYRLSQFKKLPRSVKIQHIASLLNMNIVHRNRNLDGFLKQILQGTNVAVRYLEGEDLWDKMKRFSETAHKKHSRYGVVVMPQASKEEKAKLQGLFQSPVQIVVYSYNDICKQRFNIEEIVRVKQQTHFNFRSDNRETQNETAQEN